MSSLAEQIGAEPRRPGLLVRRALGWALRDAGRQRPDRVRSHVAAPGQRPLTS